MLKSWPTDEQLARLVQQGNYHRRVSGVIIGAGVGLALGAVSQSVRSLMMPGLPFYQPPFGPAINALVCVAAGALMGLASAWPQETVSGVGLGSLIGALTVVAVTLGDRQLNWAAAPGVLLASLLLMLPFAAASVPIALCLRWAANKQEDSFRAGHFMWSRVIAPLVLALAAAGLALTMLYPPEARLPLERTNELIRQGRASSGLQALPAPLQADTLGDFPQHAHLPYTLEWTRDLGPYGQVIVPNVDVSQQAAVVARFDDGWSFVCLYPTPQAEPWCKGLQR